jgi:hypothetical protein
VGIEPTGVADIFGFALDIYSGVPFVLAPPRGNLCGPEAFIGAYPGLRSAPAASSLQPGL